MKRAFVYRFFIVGMVVAIACKQPNPAAKGSLTDSSATGNSKLMPADTGVARAMDSTINSPDKRPGGK